MAVDDDVDLVFLEHPQVHFGPQGRRGAEQDVLQFGGDHRAAPAIGQRSATSMENDVPVVLIHAHVGAMHHLHDLTVNTPGDDAQLPPQFLSLFRSPLDELQFPLLLSKLGEHLLSQFYGDLVLVSAVYLHLEGTGQHPELLFVPDLVPGRLPPGRGQEKHGCLPTVIRVGRRAGGHHAAKVPGCNGRRRGATDPGRAGRVAIGDPAWPHGAYATTGAGLPEWARLHLTDPVEDGLCFVRTHLLTELSVCQAGRSVDLHKCVGSVTHH